MAKLSGHKMGYGFQAVVTVIVALATLEATTLLQYFSSRKAMQEEATRRAEDQLESTNLLICDVLDQVETAVHNNVWPVRKTLAAPDSLWSLVRRIVECNPSVSGSTIALAENYFPQKGRLFSPYAFRDGNRIDTLNLGRESYGYPDKEWYVKPLETGEGYWSEPYYDTGGGEMLMTTYSVPVTDAEGKVAAVLTADVSLDWFTDMVGNIDVYPEAFSALISRTGKLMVCPAPALVMKKTVQEVAADLADSTTVRDIGLAMLAGEEGSRQVMYNGEKEYVFYAPIDRANWSMAIVIPQKEIYGDIQRVGLLVILLQVLGLLVMSVILYTSVKNQLQFRELLFQVFPHIRNEQLLKPVMTAVYDRDSLFQGIDACMVADIPRDHHFRSLFQGQVDLSSAGTGQDGDLPDLQVGITITAQAGNREPGLHIF